MKKVIAFAFVAGMISLAACQSKPSEETGTDTTIVDTTVTSVDTTIVDTTVVETVVDTLKK